MQEQKSGTADQPAPLRIRRTSLKDRAVARIQQAIENNELPPGQQITELGLAHSLGVAQATVREALIELEYQGFIEHLGPRNTRITALTRQYIDQIYIVRRKLESLVVDLLIGAAPEVLEPCRAAQREMQRTAQAGSPADFCRADLEFHRELWRATGNACLAESLERIVPKLFAFGIIRHYRPGRKKLLEMAEMHSRLLDVIQAGKREAAGKLMDESMNQAWTDDLQLP